MSYSIKGRIIAISDRMPKTEKFSVRFLALETLDKYSQPVKIQFVNDRMDLLDKCNVGEEVAVHFDIRGNRSKDNKIFNNLQGWKVENLNAMAAPVTAPSDMHGDNQPW